MKNKYILFFSGLFLITGYFVIGSIYISNSKLEQLLEPDSCQQATELILHDIDSVVNTVKQTHLKSQQTISKLSSAEYIRQKTVIKHNVIKKDSIVFNEIVLPVYAYDTIHVLLHDTISTPVIKLDSPPDSINH
jgi:hypothetical protein